MVLSQEQGPPQTGAFRGLFLTGDQAVPSVAGGSKNLASQTWQGSR